MLAAIAELVGAVQAPPQPANLAARLQGIAEPNTVVIAENTRKLLGNLFELEDLGSKDLKGIAGRANAWAALRASPVESRLRGTPWSWTDCSRWSGGRTRTAAPALVASKEWRRPSCCSRARLGLANRGLRRRYWNTSPASRTRACAISAPLSTPTARFIRFRVPRLDLPAIKRANAIVCTRTSASPRYLAHHGLAMKLRSGCPYRKPP
jgi:hypothetical protein